LQINEEEEKPLYNGSGTEYLSLEEASNTVNMLAYDGNKWILTSGAGSSGSGHIITNEAGETMEQQKILNFVGFRVENDGANRSTRITNPEPINNLITSEAGLGSLDAYQGKILSQRSVPAGGAKGQVLAKSGNGDHQLEWINQNSDGVITGDGSIEEIIGLTYEEYKALEAAGELKATTQYHITDMSDGDISFISTEDIQAMIDTTVQDYLPIDSFTTGEYLQVDFSDVETGWNTKLSEITLTPGVWIVMGYAQYQGENARWYLSLGGASVGATDTRGYVAGQVTNILPVTSTTTYPLTMWLSKTDSSSAIEGATTSGFIKAVKII
jgi:hypothetical protein